MTAIRSDNLKVLLPRLEGEDFWEMIHQHYAHQKTLKWKSLAILALRENAGWPLEKIGLVFGHYKGHVSRILMKVKQEMRDTFEQSPEWLCMGDGFDSDEFEEFRGDENANRDIADQSIETSSLQSTCGVEAGNA